MLRDKGLHRVSLEVFSKINKDNPDKEVGINAKCARVVELTSAMHKSYYEITTASLHSSSTHYNIV